MKKLKRKQKMQFLIDYREARGMTREQAVVAFVASNPDLPPNELFAPQTLRLWEVKGIEPSPTKLRGLAKYLGCEVAEVVAAFRWGTVPPAVKKLIEAVQQPDAVGAA